MRKWILFLLMMAFGVLPARAQADDLMTLAQYFPEGTDLWVTVRTDEATLAALDEVINRVGSRIGMPETSGLSTSIFEDFVVDRFNEYRDDEYRGSQWAGDFVAVGVIDFANTFSELTVFSLKDHDVAAGHLETMTKSAIINEQLEKRDEEVGIYYRRTNDQYWFVNSFLLLDDALLISSNPLMLDNYLSTQSRSSTATLHDNPDFNNAIGQLPQENYGVAMYIEMDAIVDQFGESADELEGIDWERVRSAVGPFAAGFAMPDDQTFSMDFVQLPGEMTLSEALGLPAPTEVDYLALDPAFAANAPVSTVFYMQGSRMGSQAMALMNDLPAILDPLISRYVLPDLEERNVRGAMALRAFTFKRLVTFAELTFKGTFGMPLDEFYGAIDGQNATFMTLRPDSELTAVLESGTVYEVTDAEKIGVFMDGFTSVLDDFRLEYTREDDVIMLPFGNSIPLDPAFFGTPTGTTVIRANDDLLFAGAERLNREGGSSLNDSPAYQAAQAHFLPEAHSIWFLNFGPVRELLHSSTTREKLFPNMPMQSQGATLSAIGLIDSASVTQVNREGTVITRWTVSLTQ